MLFISSTSCSSGNVSVIDEKQTGGNIVDIMSNGLLRLLDASPTACFIAKEEGR